MIIQKIIQRELRKSRTKVVRTLTQSLEHYKSIEGNITTIHLVMAQSTAEDIKNVAKQQADQIIKDAESDAKTSISLH